MQTGELLTELFFHTKKNEFPLFISGNRRKYQKWGPAAKDFATIPVGPETIFPDFARFPLKSLKMQLRISVILHLLFYTRISVKINLTRIFPIRFCTFLSEKRKLKTKLSTVRSK